MCSLFGLIDYQNTLTRRQKNHILQVLSKECEVRGADRQTISTITLGQPALSPWRTMGCSGTTESSGRPRIYRIPGFRPTAMLPYSCSNKQKPWISRPSARWRRRSRVLLSLRCLTGTTTYILSVVITRLQSSTSAAFTCMPRPKKFCGGRCASCVCTTGRQSILRRAIS